MKLKSEVSRWKSNIHFFVRENKFVWREEGVDFKINLANCNLIRKCRYWEFEVEVFMVKGISLGKRGLGGECLWSCSLKIEQTINFKFCTHISNRILNKALSTFFVAMSHLFFVAIICRVLKAYFSWKKFKADHSKHIWEILWVRFCLSFGWLHISANKFLKTAILLVQEIIIWAKCFLPNFDLYIRHLQRGWKR